MNHVKQGCDATCPNYCEHPDAKAMLALLKEQNDAVIEVLNAESNHNLDEARRAGCAPGVHLLGGRYDVNAAMYRLSYIGERVKALLDKHEHEDSKP